ncbi:unnamed protein product [Sphagnum jensenii]
MNDTIFNGAEIPQYTKAQQQLISCSSIPLNLRLLSHSGIQSFNSCARKFELTKLSQKPRIIEDEAGHLAFGTVVGNGVQEYLITGDLNKAIFRVFLDWKESIDSDLGEKKNKTFWHAIRAIQRFVNFRDTVLSEYELAYFEEKPATELGFSIAFGNGFFYRGKIDALMRHKYNGHYLVVEVKTTGYSVVHEAMYGNSNQATGYGLVIDKVAADRGKQNSYYVLYPVYKTGDMAWTSFKFEKSNTQRALWLQGVLYIVNHIAQYSENEYFPTNGDACFSYGKACNFYGICGYSNTLLLDANASPKFDKDGEYYFQFDLMDLIEAQQKKGE